MSPDEDVTIRPGLSAMAAPSVPLTAVETTSAVGSPYRPVVVGVLRLPCASLSVAEKVSAKFASFVGVIFSPDNVQAATSTDVVPAAAVKLWPFPSVSTAPTGIALTASEARLLVSPDEDVTIRPGLSAMAAPSVPLTAVGVNVNGPPLGSP